jgi:esterase/lipase superfamily enzyme
MHPAPVATHRAARPTVPVLVRPSIPSGRPSLCPVLIALALGLAACAQRSDDVALVPAPAGGPTATAASASSEQERVFVATTREPLPDDAGAFGSGRSPQTRYLSYDISIPPGHAPSKIEWPSRGRAPDPARDFVVTARQDYGPAGFFHALGRGAPRRDVGLYVHGFNNTMAEAVFRTAQIATDAEAGASSILFAWPSAGNPLAYVADRDASDFSRAALAGLIEDLASAPDVGRIFIIGHSMGGRLTLESLIQLSLRGRADVLRRLEVVLADPDIDEALFWEQARLVGPLKVPLTVLTAPDDKALRISRTLAGGRDRIGAIALAGDGLDDRARASGVRIIDVSSIDTDAIAHNRVTQIAAMYQQVPAAHPGDGLRQAGAYVFLTIGQGLSQVGAELGP